MNDPADINFVESPVERKILKPFFDLNYSNSWEMRLHTDTALIPLYLAKTVSRNRTDTLISSELIEQTSTFIERTRFYHQFWNKWMTCLENNNGPEFITRKSTLHLFAPLYVQELEGPLRYQLSALIDLCGAKQQDQIDWRERLYLDGDKKYFPSIQTEAIQKLQQLQDTDDTADLNDGYYYLRTTLILLAQNESFSENIEIGDESKSLADAIDISGHPNAGAIRNAIAHADYRIEESNRKNNERSEIVLTIDNTEHYFDQEAIILYINRQLTLIRALSAGISLGLLYIMLDHNEDNYAEKLLAAYDITEMNDIC